MRSEELRRIEALEQLVRALMRDVEALSQRAGVPRPAAMQPPAAPPASDAPAEPQPAAATRPTHSDIVREPAGRDERRGAAACHADAGWHSGATWHSGAAPFAAAPRSATSSPIDLEQIVGRYGTVALGATVILAGVGVLISWAVAQGLFGPHVRLALAALLAVACGGVGWRIRQRSSRRFGDILLALSLALVHAVAWGAGPVLEVVPHLAAFTLAAVASMLLAGLASAEEEQALFTVGIGGALLAPFVTLRGDSSLTLLAYGAIILLAAMLPLRRHRWLATSALVIIGCTLYAGLATVTLGREAVAHEVATPFAFTLVLAVAAVLLRIVVPLAYAFVAAALLAAHPWGGQSAPGALLPFIPLAFAALLVVYAGVIRRGTELALPAAFLLPLGTLALAVASLPPAHGAWHAAVPLSWAIAAIAMIEADAEHRQVHAFVAAVAGLAAIITAMQDRTALLLAMILYGAILAIVAERRRLKGPAAVGIAGAAFVGMAIFAAFMDRGGVHGVPFASVDSLVSAALLLGLMGTSFVLRDDRVVNWLRIAAVLVLFVWLRCELALAISADVATFALILYYAASGMLAITIGARFAIPQARHAGLIVACYAGLKALWEASDLVSVALRFGAFMLVGVFLLLVAYRYWPKRVAPAAPLSPPAN